MESVFTWIRERLEKKDAAREQIIKESRDALRDAKRAIYLCHEGRIDEAQAIVDELASNIPELTEDAHYWANIAGTYGEALEEYAEAAIFLAFVKGQDIPEPEALAIPEEQYLGGICDATGELSRRAVHMATARNVEEVERIKKTLSEINGELLKFHLRNGPLRRKYDAVKYAVKKVEEVSYDLSKQQ